MFFSLSRAVFLFVLITWVMGLAVRDDGPPTALPPGFTPPPGSGLDPSDFPPLPSNVDDPMAYIKCHADCGEISKMYKKGGDDYCSSDTFKRYLPYCETCIYRYDAYNLYGKLVELAAEHCHVNFNPTPVSGTGPVSTGHTLVEATSVVDTASITDSSPTSVTSADEETSPSGPASPTTTKETSPATESTSAKTASPSDEQSTSAKATAPASEKTSSAAAHTSDSSKSEQGNTGTAGAPSGKSASPSKTTAGHEPTPKGSGAASSSSSAAPPVFNAAAGTQQGTVRTAMMATLAWALLADILLE